MRSLPGCVRSSLIRTDVAPDRVVGKLHAGSRLDAARLHFPTADCVPFDSIVARLGRTLGVAAEVDPGFEHVLLSEHRTAELLAIFVAMSSVQPPHPVAQNSMPRPNDKDPSELHPVQFVFLTPEVLRL